MNLGLLEIARALGGEVVSGAVSCPGPGHSPRDRSLRVYADWQAPLGFRVHSLSSKDDWRACQEHVRQRLGLPAWRDTKAENAPTPAAHKEQQPAPPVSNTWAARWRKTAAPKETIAETYLVRRVGGALDWPRDLRFHPRCPGRFGEEQRLEFHPALVALYRDIQTNQPRAIHRTFLRPDGSDRLRAEWNAGDEGKKALGRSVGCVVKLSADESVTAGLGVVEGIETGLSLLALGWSPIWVTTGTSNLKTFPVLLRIEALTIFADHDEKGAGENAAKAAALRWAEAGREVQIITPRTVGTDWNDALRSAT